MPRPYNEEESTHAHTEPHEQYIGRMPILTSARGGHHHQTSYHREGHRTYHQHHPYCARPNNRDGITPTPFFSDPSHRPYEYEYFADNKPYAVPINNVSMHHQGQQIHPSGHRLVVGSLPPSEMKIKDVMNLPQPTKSQKVEAKKPPRPYTEYNIFFQLERERILGELEEEQRKKQGNDTESISKEIGDVKLDNEIVNGDAVVKEEMELIDDVVTSPNSFYEGDNQCTKPSSRGIILNRPSDSNDILPRPARFEHLQLAPLWYDSTHRLALSKANKSRRRHRKTHGLVGFLELTKRISKAWAEADVATKEYCKRVADRQLQIYKEELKLWKTRSDVLTEELVCGNAEGKVGHPESCTSGTNLQQHVREQSTLHERDKPIITGDVRAHPNNVMPPPPPPSHPLAMSSSTSSAHHSFNHRYNEYWQHQQVLYQRQGPYLHPVHPQHHMPGQPPYHIPVIPALTPDSEGRCDQNACSHGEVSVMNHTPLDELMHRRKLYGSRVSTDQNPQKFRSPGTSRQERTSSKTSSKNDAGVDVHKKSEQAREACANPGKSYLSPSEITVRSPSSTMAVTPSPSRRHATSQPKDDANAGLDADLSAAITGDGKDAINLSPNSASPGSSVIYAISPSCMMTPGASPKCGEQHASEGSYLNGGFGEGDFSSSPFPYIDWGSPHDKSPPYGRIKGHPSGAHAGQGETDQSIPSNLTVPGINVVSRNPYGHYSVYRSPGSSRFASMMPPSSPYPIVDGNAGELDLEEEEIQLLWRRLASHANRKRLRERDAAAAWVYHNHGLTGSFSASPGGDKLSGDGRFESSIGGNFAMAHSFSSPIERPEMRKTSTRPIDHGDVSNNNIYGYDTEKTKEVPSLQDAM